MIFLNVIIIILICINKIIGNKIVLNAVAFAIDPNKQSYTSIVSDFNRYAEDHDLNLVLELNLFTVENSTTMASDYNSMIETLVKKAKKNKYHFYFYDSTYISNYGPYLLDLSQYLPKDHIDIYNSDILSYTCYYKDKLVGLPFTLGFTVLYSNIGLLNKYHKRIPKTWDELIETSQYIVEEEKRLNNNTNLMAYNGLFNDKLESMCSSYEFIYSFRKKVDSPLPELTSKEAVKAFEMIRKIKDTISSDEEFSSDDTITFAKLMNGEALFLKFWLLFKSLLNAPSYVMSPLPGYTEGISASTIAGYNLGISKYIEKNEEEREAALSVFKYLTSIDVQKTYFKTGLFVPGIFSLFQDREVCPSTECEVFDHLQVYGRPTNITKNYDEYSEKFLKYTFEFIYGKGNKTALETLSKIEDITKIHHVSFHSTIGLSGVITLTFFILIMWLSLLLPFNETLYPFFKLLPLDFWMISVMGSILILSGGYTEIGAVTDSKCHSMVVLLSFGVTMNYIPFLYRLVKKFPGEDDFLKRITQHRYLFFSFFLLIDLFLCLLLIHEPYEIEEVYVSEGKNFKKCKINYVFNHWITMFILIYKGITVTLLLLFIFLEWSIKETRFDIKFIVLAIYIDLLLFILSICLSYISVSDYIWHYIARMSFFLIMGFSNYLFLYGYKLTYAIIHKQNATSVYNRKISRYFIEEENKEYPDDSRNETTNSYDEQENIIDNHVTNLIKTPVHDSNNTIMNHNPRKLIMKKMINYHFTTGDYEEIDNLRYIRNTNSSNTFDHDSKSTI